MSGQEAMIRVTEHTDPAELRGHHPVPPTIVLTTGFWSNKRAQEIVDILRGYSLGTSFLRRRRR